MARTSDRTASAPRWKILLVDDHPSVRECLALRIAQESDMEVCASVGDKAQAMPAVRQHGPDLVILDMNLPDGHGLDLIKDIRAFDAKTRMLVFSMHDERVYGERALRAGAQGYVMKCESPDQVVDAVRSVLGGRLAVSDWLSQRLAGEASRQGEACQEDIIQSPLDAILTIDHGGYLVEFNPAAEKMFGHARAEVIGKSLAELINPVWLRERHQHELARFLAGGKGPLLNCLSDLSALRADGSAFTAEFVIIPIPNTDPQMFVVFLHDITGRRASDKSLAEHTERLLQADRRKDEFLAFLAHELRNPLNSLRHVAGILLPADVGAGERSEAGHIMTRQISNMTRMIDDLLDVSRITEGKMELRRQPVALEAVLTAASSVALAALTAHRQELTITLPAEPVYLNADATRLEQVFNNLLANACKYSGEGCHISMDAERSTDGAGLPEVAVRVRDDGIGIAPELLPRIFDLFVQANRTPDRAVGGLGIGLTLVQRLVKLHGGTIEAHSEGLGHGSEFVVRLPILREAPSSSSPPQELASVRREAPRRILIVDDNTDSARSLASLQKRRGHETRTAFTGPDALTVAAEFLPEVILLDIGLPGIDGLEVARRIRTMPGMEGAFLVAMSGYGTAEDQATAKQAGFSQYLVKPADLTLLNEWILNLE